MKSWRMGSGVQPGQVTQACVQAKRVRRDRTEHERMHWKCIRQLISAVLLMMAATSVVGQPQESDTVTTADTTAESVAVDKVTPDEQISARIKRILVASGWFEAPEVKVTDGIVFLDGQARTEAHRTWARDIASRTQDVVAVVNRVELSDELTWTLRPAIEELRRLARKAITVMPLVLLSIVVMPLAWYLARMFAALARHLMVGRVDSPFLRDVIARAVALPVLLLGFYIILQVAGLTRLAFSLVGGAGVIGIVVGFAFRDIAENFLASLLLSIRQPFNRGDRIEVAGHFGIVQGMNTRSTVLLSQEGNHIQIPNAAVFKSTIVNYSAAAAIRGVVDVGIGYDDSVVQAQDVVMKALQEHEAVNAEPGPLVLVDSLGASTVNIKVYYWFDGHLYEPIKVKSALLRIVKAELTNAGISMPDEAREIVFPNGVPIVSDTQRTLRLPMEQDELSRQRERIEEDTDNVSQSEGGLSNESAEIEAQAASTQLPEGEQNLLQS